MFGLGMLVGGTPLTFIILLITFLSATHDARKAAGYSSGGDALGLLMMSLVAYAIALLSCVNGISYFIFKAIKQHSFPTWWQWLILSYSFVQVAGPFIYFFVLDLR
jgi:hypothetical protein